MGILESLSLPFMQRALVAGISVAASSAVLGLFLVLRRYASIGDGLAHVGLSAVALGLFLGATPMYVALPVTALASLWILALSERSGLYGETAVGLVSSVAAAVAVLLASLGKGFSVDLMSYLFGSLLAVSRAEAWIAAATAALVLALVLALRRPLFSLVYDPDFAKVSGVRVEALGRLLVVLAGLAVGVGIRVVGSLLVSSLIVLPAVTALQLGLGFGPTLAAAAAFSVAAVLAGVMAALVLDLPAGASVVLVLFLFFCLAWLAGRLRTRPRDGGPRHAGRGTGAGR